MFLFRLSNGQLTEACSKSWIQVTGLGHALADARQLSDWKSRRGLLELDRIQRCGRTGSVMKIGKTGKTGKRIVAPTSKVQLAEPGAVGRPSVHQEKWTKATVILLDRQIIHLDRIATDLRERFVTNRAEIIRILIDALIDSGLEIRGVTSKEELKNLLTVRLKTRGPAK